MHPATAIGVAPQNHGHARFLLFLTGVCFFLFAAVVALVTVIVAGGIDDATGSDIGLFVLCQSFGFGLVGSIFLGFAVFAPTSSSREPQSLLRGAVEPDAEMGTWLAPVAGLFAIVAGIWGMWCTIVGFIGGTMPIIGYETDGSVGLGLFMLFIGEPLLLTVAYWVTMLALMPFLLFANRKA